MDASVCEGVNERCDYYLELESDYWLRLALRWEPPKGTHFWVSNPKMGRLWKSPFLGQNSTFLAKKDPKWVIFGQKESILTQKWQKWPNLELKIGFQALLWTTFWLQSMGIYPYFEAKSVSKVSLWSQLELPNWVQPPSHHELGMSFKTNKLVLMTSQPHWCSRPIFEHEIRVSRVSLSGIHPQAFGLGYHHTHWHSWELTLCLADRFRW